MKEKKPDMNHILLRFSYMKCPGSTNPQKQTTGYWLEYLVLKGRMSLMASKNVLKGDRGVIAHHWKNTTGCWSMCALIFPLATFYPFFKSSLLVTHFQLPFTLFTNTVCVRECRFLHVTALGWRDVCLPPWVPGIHLRLTCLLRKRHHPLSHLTG